MRIRLHKVSDERYRLEVHRADGSCERRDNETRSLLRHDLMHVAVEREAGLATGFWGRLAAGATLAELDQVDLSPPAAADAELAAIERVVGVLHDGGKGRSPAQLVEALRRMAASGGGALPTWVDEPTVTRVLARYASLRGAWQATRFGAALELEW